MKLILKDAVLAEIENRIEEYKDRKVDSSYTEGLVASLEVFRDEVINFLEVTEVDLNAEIDKEYLKRMCYGGKYNMLVILNKPKFTNIAKHFFELGVNASNPLTWKDMKLIWNIGDEIPYMPEEDFFKELLKRFKAQKGEKV